MEIKNKQDLASAITNFFKDERNLNLIKNYLKNEKTVKLGAIIGNVIHYFVLSRNSNLEQTDFEQIIKGTIENNELSLGKVYVKHLKNYLLQKNIEPSETNVLRLFKKHHIDNGFYMHAFNGATIPIIKEKGLSGKNNFLSNQRQVMSRYLRYDYDVSSYKIFATDYYALLNGYGNVSPEWLFYFLNKNSDCVRNRDKNQALNTIVEYAKICKPNITENEIAKLIESSKVVLDHYMQEKDYGIVIMDKNLKINGKKVFNRYQEEEPVNDDDFDFDLYKDNIKNVFNKKYFEKELSTDELLALGVMGLLTKYTVYEVSTIFDIEPSDFEIATVPIYKKIFSNQKEKQIEEMVM